MERGCGDREEKLTEQSREAASGSSSITNPNYCGPEDEDSPGVRVQQMQCVDEGSMVIVYCNTDYLFSCSGAIRLLQVVHTLIMRFCCCLVFFWVFLFFWGVGRICIFYSDLEHHNKDKYEALN